MFLYSKKANGKLLLSGEYFVLNGAKALVLPVRFGQLMTVKSVPNAGIQWSSIDCKGNVYFSTSFLIDSTHSINPIEERLKQLFQICIQETPEAKISGLEFRVEADFDLNWGLGSSSTLVYLLADYFKINPYLLLEKSFGGSGYDIAAASKDSTFLYNRSQQYNPLLQDVSLHTCWEDHICFVYLGNKQDSREGIRLFKSKFDADRSLNEEIAALTESMVSAESYEDIQSAFFKHEDFIATHLSMRPIQERLFSDYVGAIKSLGAWGGDFIAVAFKERRDEVERYFAKKGYNTLFFYKDIMIKK